MSVHGDPPVPLPGPVPDSPGSPPATVSKSPDDYPAGTVLKRLDEKADGVAVPPSRSELESGLKPREDETPERASERVMQEFADSAAVIDRRISGAATASAFGIAITGLVLRDDSPVNQTVAALLGGVAALAFILAYAGLSLHVAKVPAVSPSLDTLERARKLVGRKELYAQFSSALGMLVLLGFVVAFAASI